MPDEMIRIQCGAFRCVVHAEALGGLPKANTRKLLRLMRQGDNREEILRLGQILRRMERECKTQEMDAQMREKLQWRFIPNRSMRPEHIAIRAKNRSLRENTKLAKAVRERIESLLAVYNEIFI